MAVLFAALTLKDDPVPNWRDMIDGLQHAKGRLMLAQAAARAAEGCLLARLAQSLENNWRAGKHPAAAHAATGQCAPTYARPIIIIS